jgi:ferredoxin
MSRTRSRHRNEDQAAEITILPDRERVAARPEETLLAALSRAGLGYRIGCRRGGCGVCKLHLLPGEVRYERAVAESVLSDEEGIEGICLSCRAVPITNVVMEPQEETGYGGSCPSDSRPASWSSPKPVPDEQPWPPARQRGSARPANKRSARLSGWFSPRPGVGVRCPLATSPRLLVQPWRAATSPTRAVRIASTGPG